jgi:predicted aspartyl protease
MVKNTVGGLRFLCRFGLAAMMLGVIAQPRAEECQLKLQASVNVKRMADGRMLVPVTVDDHPVQLILDTGSALTSALSESVATSLNLRIFPMRQRVVDVAGHVMDHGADARDLRLDHLHIDRTQFIISPWFHFSDPDIGGTLGPELIRKFDLDIDPAANKMQLFSQDHCPGKVVYWTKDWFDVPIKVLHSGHVTLDVEIDGKPVTAVLDTGFVKTTLSMPAAHRLFGLDKDSPKVVEAENSGSGGHTTFRYQFNMLTVSGLTINHPNIFLVGDKIGKPLTKDDFSNVHMPTDEATRLPDLIIGMEILSKLHFYIAYGEQHFYASAAGAH